MCVLIISGRTVQKKSLECVAVCVYPRSYLFIRTRLFYPEVRYIVFNTEILERQVKGLSKHSTPQREV